MLYNRRFIMPPKVKITKKDIIDTTIALIRKSGPEAINARAIAGALNCSTQPIFSNFRSMEELEEETLTAAYNIYISFLNREAESERYPKYKSFGMAYIRFAKEEKELFKLLFMCDREGKELVPTPDFDTSIKIIMDSTGISEEKARLIHTEMWIFVHGIGTILATSFLSLDWNLISDMLSDIYQGIMARHLSEVK